MARSSNSPLPLAPARALLHPLWLGSLAMLVLNDHVLKGAGLLPAPLTGKLSDFAGMLVAPALLAAVARVRSVRGWVLAHVAVGVVFSAIQLSAFAAQQWSAAMAMVGFPWEITRDATDLMALPALLLGAWMLLPAMRQPTPAAARRRAELAAAGTGLLCCAATSPAEPDPDPNPWRPTLWTDVFVHNHSEEPVVVRLRPLAEGIELDCNVAAEDPGRLLTEPLFGQSQSFRLDPDQNFGLRLNDTWGWDGDTDGVVDGSFEGDCYAYLLDVDGLPPAVVFWEVGQVPEHEVAGEGHSGSPGEIDLLPPPDADHLGTYQVLGEDELVFLVPPAEPPVTGACAPQSDANRLEWSEPVPVGAWELLAIDRGPDGCFALDIGVRDLDGQVFNEDRWYLCAPLLDLGLEPGRMFRVAQLSGTGLNDGGVALTTEDDPALGLPHVELWAYRGVVFPEFRGVSVAAVPEFDCDYVVGESCGTITRATSLVAGGGAFGTTTLEPGASQTLMGDTGSMTLVVAHAEERAALDAECAEGPDNLGLDLEVVALYSEPNAG